MGVSVRVNLDDALDNLLKTSEMNSVQKTEPRQRQADWMPGVTWQGEEGTVTTQPMEGDNAPDWSGVLRMWGLDPEYFAVVEPVLFNVWGDPLGVLNRQWKGKIVRIQDSKKDYNLDKLKEEIKNHKRKKVEIIYGEGVFNVVLADWN